VSNKPFDTIQREYRERVEAALDRFLSDTDAAPKRLTDAMRYACLNGGKRVRAMLVYATGEAVNADPVLLDTAACAVEMVHAYSLVHDDLPAMDDDDLRRGKPSCHIAYDEATAILAGDALLTLAFEILATGATAPADHLRRLNMVQCLARAAGTAGMTGGQVLDLEAVGQELSRDQLAAIHQRKTGALIQACVQLGALSGDVSASEYTALDQYSQHLGIAFQIVDDILDEVSNTATLGKTTGADRARNKPTYPSIIGLEASKRLAEDLYRQATGCLDTLAKNAYTLRQLAEMVVHRTY
jgi:geranylgeranyl pyrophosphate synthase